MKQSMVNDIESPCALVGRLDAAGILAAADDRKLNSFCCACCRLIWPDLVMEAQSALEAAERYVNGLASSEELFAERIRMWKFWDSMPDHNRISPEVDGVRAVICCLGERDIKDPDLNYEYDLLTWTVEFCKRVKPNQGQLHYQLLLDVFGSPPI